MKAGHCKNKHNKKAKKAKGKSIITDEERYIISKLREFGYIGELINDLNIIIIDENKNVNVFEKSIMNETNHCHC
jgi:hypothetical protein